MACNNLDFLEFTELVESIGAFDSQDMGYVFVARIKGHLTFEKMRILVENADRITVQPSNDEFELIIKYWT